MKNSQFPYLEGVFETWEDFAETLAGYLTQLIILCPFKHDWEWLSDSALKLFEKNQESVNNGMPIEKAHMMSTPEALQAWLVLTDSTLD